MSEETNARLRERIEAAKARGTDIAGDTARKASDFVQEHPVAVVAGGLVLGAIVAGALSRRRRSSARDVVAEGSSRLSKLAALGAEMAMAYAAKAADVGKDGIGKIEDIGGTVTEKLSEGGAEAKKRASDVADIAMAGARAAGEAAMRRANEIASKIRH